MEKVKLSNKLEVSRIVLGVWRLLEWQMPDQQLLKYIEDAMELGVSTFDHADIYGDYGCEEAFGKALRHKPALREQMQLISKCGIKLVSPKHPQRKIGYYDTSYTHIVESAEKSLQKLGTDYLDLLLIHRPDPLMDPSETARAFEKLEKEGKVLNFGVSNFTPMQFEMLDAHFPGRLVTNQVEISPYSLEHFQNGNMEFFLKKKIHPMAWSPTAGGRLFRPDDAKSERVQKVLKEISAELQVEGIDKIIYAWILQHPAKSIPIVGSGKLERLKAAIEALEIKLSREQWFRILVASQGHPVP